LLPQVGVLRSRVCQYTFGVRFHQFRAATALFFVSLVVGVWPLGAQDAGWQQDLAAWRTGHAAELRKPDGWLALAGLEWLSQGDNTFGSAADNKIRLPASGPANAGILHLEGMVVRLNPPASGFPPGLLIDGKPAQSRELPAGANSDKGNPRMTMGPLNLYVVRRGDRFALRIKDAKSAAIAEFHGLKWYPADAAFRLKAQWVPYTPPKSITLATLIGSSYDRPVPGAAEFFTRVFPPTGSIDRESWNWTSIISRIHRVPTRPMRPARCLLLGTACPFRCQLANSAIMSDLVAADLIGSGGIWQSALSCRTINCRAKRRGAYEPFRPVFS
jgi:uncharacterized protein (DUF1684 family)